MFSLNMVSERLAYIAALSALVLTCACTREVASPSAAEGGRGQLLLPVETKAAPFNPADVSTLSTYRAILLDSDFPWGSYAAEGTYCNICKYPASAAGEKWYHALRCDDNGAPLTDIAGDEITSWSGSEGAYLANGSIPEFEKGTSATDTWGNSKWALWADNSTPGISDRQRAFRLWMISPARKLTGFLPDGMADELTNYSYGLQQKRTEAVYQSPATPVVLSGTYLNHFGKAAQYVYRADLDPSDSADDQDLTLTDHRSQLSVKMYVDEILDEVHIKRIVLTNYITEGIYLPIDENTGKPMWVPLGLDTDGSGVNYDLTGEITLHYKDGSGAVNEPTQVFHDHYLLSQDYSELDAKGNAIHPVPTLAMMLLSSKGEEVEVDIPLSWNLEPMHHYKLTLRIATWYIYVYVQGLAWDEESEQELEFGQRPDIVFYLEYPLGTNWEDGGDHNTSI